MKKNTKIIKFEKGSRTFTTQCLNCGFEHTFIDGHYMQYNYCPQCSVEINWVEAFKELFDEEND